nr:hypothetical protein [Piscirickettsia salmonis]
MENQSNLHCANKAMSSQASAPQNMAQIPMNKILVRGYIILVDWRGSLTSLRRAIKSGIFTL